MANYVANKIVCSQAFYDNYLFDANPFGEETPDEYVRTHPYITFNRLYGVNSIGEYSEQYGTYVAYSHGYTVEDYTEDEVIVKFMTRWHYPIHAIVKAIEIDHTVEWFCVEENSIYLSKFYWKNGKTVEATLYIEDEYYDRWEKLTEEQLDMYRDCDDLVWYMDWGASHNWMVWETDDLIERYCNQMPWDDYWKWSRNKPE